MLRKIRKSRVRKEEIIADIVFLAVSLFVAEIGIFLFDFHWNFYQSGDLFAKQIFQDKSIYLWGGAFASIAGLIIIKLLLFGFREEEIALSKKKKRK